MGWEVLSVGLNVCILVVVVGIGAYHLGKAYSQIFYRLSRVVVDPELGGTTLPRIDHWDEGSAKSHEARVKFKVETESFNESDGSPDEPSQQICNLYSDMRYKRDPKLAVVVAQHLLLQNKSKGPYNAKSGLVIGVDATPSTFAGYCVNLRQRSLSFYVYKWEDCQMRLTNPLDSSEFEMKNLIFALKLWETEILDEQMFRIYTDNYAIWKAEYDLSGYGKKAKDLINHLTVCKEATLSNKNRITVHRFRDLENFAQYITPADDLSRWEVPRAVNFLIKLYGMHGSSVHGTHQFVSKGFRNHVPLRATEHYHRFLQKAKSNMASHRCRNTKCSLDNFFTDLDSEDSISPKRTTSNHKLAHMHRQTSFLPG